MTEPSRTKVLLVEDHQVVREGLRSLLQAQPELEVVGEASDGTEALALAEQKRPDIVVMDISLKGLDGIEATKRLRKTHPEIQVVVLTMHDDAPTVDRALHAGARGYVLKGSGVKSLCDAIRAVSRGEAFLSPDVSHYVLQGYLRKASGEEAADPLSDRERQVLDLIAEGFTGRQIAERLGLRPKTIENHRARIMEKLDIHTTAGLVRYALRADPKGPPR
jgi:DNA-binding NarL/FixJ family response regulator